MRGFVVIELIIVIAFVVILSALAWPFYKGIIARTPVENTARDVVEVLRRAQTKAHGSEMNSTWGVHFVNGATGTDYYEVFKGDTFASGTVVERINLNETVQFISPPQAASADVLFSKLSGLPTGTSSLIISLISDPTNTKTISVLGAGQIDY